MRLKKDVMAHFVILAQKMIMPSEQYGTVVKILWVLQQRDDPTDAVRVAHHILRGL